MYENSFKEFKSILNSTTFFTFLVDNTILWFIVILQIGLGCVLMPNGNPIAYASK